MKSPARTPGFTLSETLIALTVFALLMGGVTAFYLETTKASYASAQRLALGYNLRRFSDEMLVHASRANEVILYTSSKQSDRNGSLTDPKAGRLPIAVVDGVTKHPVGDFIVFVYYKIPKLLAEPKHGILKIEGYFLEGGGGEIGKLKKFRINCGVIKDGVVIPSMLSVEEILNASWPTAEFTDFALNVKGLVYSEFEPAKTEQKVPRLFFRNDPRSLTISGQIFQSNKDKNTEDWKTYTQSFNFVVATRS